MRKTLQRSHFFEVPGKNNPDISFQMLQNNMLYSEMLSGVQMLEQSECIC